MRTIKPAALFVSLIGATLLFGCSGGPKGVPGDDGGGDGGGGLVLTPPAPSPETLHFFRGSLRALDPREPDLVHLVEEDLDFGDPVATVVSGGFDTELPGFRDLHASHVLFGRGQDAFVVDARLRSAEDGDPLPPESVLLGTFAGRVRSFLVGTDLSGSKRTSIVVVHDDRVVDEDDFFLDDDAEIVEDVVVIGPDGPGPPVPFPGRSVAALVDPKSGAHAGWLGIENGSLTHVDTDLVAQTLAPADFATFLGGTASGSVFLSLDGSLAVYDTRSKGLTITTFDAFALNAVPDSTNLYFLVEEFDSSGIEVFKAAPDGTVTSLAVHDDKAIDTQGNPESIGIAGDRVVYTYALDAKDELGDALKVLRSVRKNGADPKEVARGRISAETSFEGTGFGLLAFGFRLITAGERVFFTENDLGGSAAGLTGGFSAVSVRADGTGRTSIASAAWRGSTRASTSLPGYSPITASRLYARDGASGFDAFFDAGAGIHAVDPRNPGTLQRPMGVVPDDVIAFSLFPGYGETRIAMGVVAEGFDPSGFDPNNIDDEPEDEFEDFEAEDDDGDLIGGVDIDIFMLDERSADSLLKLTERADKDFLPLELF